jgi:hypothetical protein
MAIVSGPGHDAGAPPLYVQVDAAPEADGPAGIYAGRQTRADPAQRVIAIARDVYGDGLDLARRCAEQAAARFDTLAAATAPAEIEVQLAIKLDASLGAGLVQTGAEAQLQVTFRWTPGARPAVTGGGPDHGPARGSGS